MFALNVEKHPVVLLFLIYHQKEEDYMEINKFVEMLAQVNQMDHRQRNTLLTALSHLPDEPQVVEIIESRFDVDGACPFCGHDQYYRHGFVNKLQRYRCRDCKKTFNALTALHSLVFATRINGSTISKHLQIR